MNNWRDSKKYPNLGNTKLSKAEPELSEHSYLAKHETFRQKRNFIQKKGCTLNTMVIKLKTDNQFPMLLILKCSVKQNNFLVLNTQTLGHLSNRELYEHPSHHKFMSPKQFQWIDYLDTRKG